MSKSIAFFDFDGTLTYKDTLVPFLRKLRGTPRFSLDMIQLSPWLSGYGLGLIKNDIAKQKLLKHSLGGMILDELKHYSTSFAKHDLPAMIRQDTLECLQTHQSNGDICVLVSASLNIYLDPWTHDNQLDYCICSSLETDSQNKVTGKLENGNCFGEEKVKRIKTLLETLDTPTKTFAYGNSKGDIPMLKFVDEGYWVDQRITRFTG